MVYSKLHKRSHRGDLSNLASLLPVFGTLKAAEITPTQIDPYLASRTELAPATFNRYRSTLSMVFQEGMRNGKCDKNFARLVRLRKKNNARIRFITYEEEDVIRRVILGRCPWHEEAFDLALETGMRLSEQHTATWPQVDFTRGQLTLTATKNGFPRIVILTERAITALKRLRGRQAKVPTDRWMLTRYGLPLDNPKAWFQLVMKDAVAICPALADVIGHVFRHTYISRLVMAGVDLRTVQELAGHKDVSMTIRYSHLSPDHRLSVVDRLEAHRRSSR